MGDRQYCVRRAEGLMQVRHIMQWGVAARARAHSRQTLIKLRLLKRRRCDLPNPTKRQAVLLSIQRVILYTIHCKLSSNILNLN